MYLRHAILPASSCFQLRCSLNVVQLVSLRIIIRPLFQIFIQFVTLVRSLFQVPIQTPLEHLYNFCFHTMLRGKECHADTIHCVQYCLVSLALNLILLASYGVS